MSDPQTPKKSLNAFKDELYGALRQIESDFKFKFNELESKLKTDIENFSSKINLLSQENKEIKELYIPQKIKIDKITELEAFKNKVDDMLISHEVRIKNNSDEVTKVQLKYDRLISQNLYVPGYIGYSCQFKTLSEYLSYNINEVSKIKIEREQLKKDFKELKTKQENMIKSIATLNDSTVQICNNYADGKNHEIKMILKRALDELNQKNFEMKTMIHQFAENAKNIEIKSKEELEKITEIKSSISNVSKTNMAESKKLYEEMTKKLKDNNSEMNANRKKLDNIIEQIKEINKNINNNNNLKNSSNNMTHNKSKINFSNSISPNREKKPYLNKSLMETKKSSLHVSTKFEGKNNNNNKSGTKNTKSEISDFESVISENSGLNINNNNVINTNENMYNMKQTKEMEINTDNNEIIDLKEIKNKDKDKEKINLNTIGNINDLNKLDKFKNSLNYTNTTNSNNNKNIPSIQNSKSKIIINNINNKTKGNNNPLLPSILKKKEYYEESKKGFINNMNSLSPKRKKSNVEEYGNNNRLRIKSTKIVFQSDNDNEINNNNYNNEFAPLEKVKSKTIKISDQTQTNIPKFGHKKEILLKRSSDALKNKEKNNQGCNIISLTLVKPNQSDEEKTKNPKDELSSTIDNYRAKAFTNIKNTNDNNIDINEEMLDFPRKVKQAFGRTTYNFFSKNDVINHINANKNVNNFDYINNKSKK